MSPSTWGPYEVRAESPAQAASSRVPGTQVSCSSLPVLSGHSLLPPWLPGVSCGPSCGHFTLSGWKGSRFPASPASLVTQLLQPFFLCLSSLRPHITVGKSLCFPLSLTSMPVSHVLPVRTAPTLPTHTYCSPNVPAEIMRRERVTHTHVASSHLH